MDIFSVQDSGQGFDVFISRNLFDEKHFYEKVVLLIVKEFHGLYDDLKII